MSSVRRTWGGARGRDREKASPSCSLRRL